MLKHNSERMLTPRTNSSVTLPLPRGTIWESRTIYSEGTKYADPQLECSSLAVKCERAFHATSNVILDGTMHDSEKCKYMQSFNMEIEVIALEVLNQVRQVEYLQKHGLKEGTFTLSKEELEVMCSREEKKRRRKEKEILIELLGEGDAAKLRRKWRKEKREERRNKGQKKKEL